MKDFYIWDDILEGRNVSFGINAGYVLPFVTSSSGGGFTGSPVNYSFGDSRENVDYSSQSGFSVGLVADIRLYKNFFLLTGVNYVQLNYTNRFNETFNNKMLYTINSNAYVATTQTNNYEEKTTLGMLEVPILASYRFVFSKISSLHLNLGPFISYGLSAKDKLTGSSEAEGNTYLITKNYEVDYSSKVGSFVNNTHTSGDFNLYEKDFVITEVTENGADYESSNKRSYSFSESPFCRLNYGIRLGATYEIRGFQLQIGYRLQLSNMANKQFWESSRIPVFNQTGANNMSGYKHRVHYLEFKLGYVFRK